MACAEEAAMNHMDVEIEDDQASTGRKTVLVVFKNRRQPIRFQGSQFKVPFLITSALGKELLGSGVAFCKQIVWNGMGLWTLQDSLRTIRQSSNPVPVILRY